MDINDHSGAWWDSGAGWNPIAGLTLAYTARFHGNGHIISNLFLNRSGTDRGLFGRISGNARLEFIGVENANVSGGTDVGILVGEQGASVIYGSYTTGQASGTHRVGGISGRSAGQVQASFSTATVNASTQRAGGAGGEFG